MDVPAPPDVISAVPHEVALQFRKLGQWAFNNLNKMVRSDAGTAQIYLIAPNQSVWGVTVDNSGRLQSTFLAPGHPQAAGAPPTFTFAPIIGYAESAGANPAGTTSATYRMMGLGLSLASVVASAAWATADGQITNSANNGLTNCVICYGTGTPPANGALQTGTIASQPARYVSTAANDYVPFSITALITGLVSGTTYWLDLAVSATGGTGKVMDVDFSVHGLA